MYNTGKTWTIWERLTHEKARQAMSDKIIEPNTDITIHMEKYGYVYGKVIHAYNYGTVDQPDWYIEFECFSPAWLRGIVYWKQGIDGGELFKIGQPAPE